MLLTSLFAKSMAAKITLGVIGASVGATAVAAQAGLLPAPAQQVAHEVAGTVGVPAPSASPRTVTPADLPSTSPSRGPEASESPEPRESESPEPRESEAPEANESHKPDCHSGKSDCEWHGKGWPSRSPEPGSDRGSPQPESGSHGSGKQSHKPKPGSGVHD